MTCDAQNVASVRVEGTLRVLRTAKTERVEGVLSLDIALRGDVAPHKVLGQDVLVSGAYDGGPGTAILAALNNVAIALIRLDFTQPDRSFVDYDGVRYPTQCRLTPRS